MLRPKHSSPLVPKPEDSEEWPAVSVSACGLNQSHLLWDTAGCPPLPRLLACPGPLPYCPTDLSRDDFLIIHHLGVCFWGAQLQTVAEIECKYLIQYDLLGYGGLHWGPSSLNPTPHAVQPNTPTGRCFLPPSAMAALPRARVTRFLREVKAVLPRGQRSGSLDLATSDTRSHVTC